MQIPETPTRLEDLDLMRRLKDYSEGRATWYLDAAAVGENARKESGKLYTGLVTLVDKALARLLDRITAREMETFTMHDRMHGNKVAHLMWHIIPTERRERLTPPEIGLLIGAAFLHDVGMALSPAERDARLDPESDLWERLEVDESLKQAIGELRASVRDENLGETQRRRAERQLAQAEELLLSQDTRERHATEQRYEEVLDGLVQMSQIDPERIPDPRAALSFDGDSFRKKLVEVCVSHGQDAESLVESDRANAALPRFPKDYPVGCCNADVHLAAAALRLADILDFDRERTPSVLFHYLLPGPLTSAGDNRSILEWGKHLTIANWHIEDDAIVFRGRSTSHIVHHAVVQFTGEVEKEIEATRATFGAFQKGDWPFILPRSVQVDITPDGYRYVPYRFELDDERVYTLLMGGAIYNQPLVAVRELIQNAVDACKLRDALLRMNEPELEPKKDGRITITYREADAGCASPVLVIEDTGIGMDEWVLERFFLKVGRSYYRSSEFSRTRVDLRRHGLDFAPVSEFGIGFLSSFLIADQVRVETAMAESIRRDTRKRTLIIDGPTRLIRLDEQDTSGPARQRGTRVSLLLTRGSPYEKNRPPSWDEIERYIKDVCQDLPYSLMLVHSEVEEEEQCVLRPLGVHITVPPEWLPFTFRIPIADEALGFEGEVVLRDRYEPVPNSGRNNPVFVDVDDTFQVRRDPRRDLSAGGSGVFRGGF
ncbi:MAG TPA: ATP-binding protein, partial [Longimicrobium sp.]|nr:ATP-binding protein [Longimicrobium sp.]